MDYDIQYLEIFRLDRNAERQMRTAKDETCIEEYKERMLEGDHFPPIEVYYDGEVYRVVDGYQRVEAAARAGLTAIDAIVRDGGAREAFLAAVGANKQHGLRRTNADKKKAVMSLLRDSEWQRWSNSEIASHCGVSHTFVSKIRTGLEEKGELEPVTRRRVERNGQVYEMDVSNLSGSGATGDGQGKLPPGLGGENYNPDDGGYDGPLDWDPSEGDAGYRPAPTVPQMPDSWLNKANNPVTVRLEMTGVRMASGVINLGNGRTLQQWPLTVPIMGFTLTLLHTDEDDESATSTATYGLH